MYEAFFSLEDAPFVLTPDPRFLLRSKGHHEVLSTLIYGITSQKGLMALIGDVGTGKTMLCRALLRELPKDVQSALVLNPYLSDVELLGTILDDLGVERRGTTKGELMSALSQHLLTSGAEGKTVVVILDEAQQMSPEALEQIRILSTIETATRKLLQVVLVGQPELEELLKRRELRQLDQRIAIRCYLKALTRKDTFRYVEHRLRIAGLAGTLPFSRAALARIYKHSGGIPRVINLVCDRSLTVAFSARAREITPPMVKLAIKSLAGERVRRRRPAARGAPRSTVARKLGRIAAGVAAVLLVGAAVATAYRTGWSPATVHLMPRPSIRQGASPGSASATGAVPPPAAVSIGASGLVDQGAHVAAGTTDQGGLKRLLAQVLTLWGVKEDLSEQAAAAWPMLADGAPDVSAIAARYQLSATQLPETTLDELRAVDLPAILEVADRSGRRAYLLRRLDGGGATLISSSGAEVRLTVDELDASWARAAWVIWRNVDNLPVDPNKELTPIVLATLGLRLQKLGLLGPPLPTTNSERLQQAVRRFQASVGLPLDGIAGPRTTLALARVVSGRFGPSLGGASVAQR